MSSTTYSKYTPRKKKLKIEEKNTMELMKLPFNFGHFKVTN